MKQKIAEILPDGFTLVLDGWTDVDSYHIGVFAPFSKEQKKEKKNTYERFSFVDTS